jgi:hypothetical protein
MLYKFTEFNENVGAAGNIQFTGINYGSPKIGVRGYINKTGKQYSKYPNDFTLSSTRGYDSSELKELLTNYSVYCTTNGIENRYKDIDNLDLKSLDFIESELS